LETAQFAPPLKCGPVQLLKSSCPPFMLNAVEAVSLSSANCCVLENCTKRALYKIFGPCDDLDFLRSCNWIGLYEST